MEEAFSPTSQAGGATNTPDDGMGATARDAGLPDDDGPAWPDAVAESAYLREQSAGGGMFAGADAKPSRSGGEDEADSAADKGRELPSLDGLSERVPAESRALLEELFRARFVRVERIPKKFITGQ